MAHDQEVVGSNPCITYWMDVSKLPDITLKKNYNKGSQMGHIEKKKIITLKLQNMLIYNRFLKQFFPVFCYKYFFFTFSVLIEYLLQEYGFEGT
jgi:hypothetical protein